MEMDLNGGKKKEQKGKGREDFTFTGIYVVQSGTKILLKHRLLLFYTTNAIPVFQQYQSAIRLCGPLVEY